MTFLKRMMPLSLISGTTAGPHHGSVQSGVKSALRVKPPYQPEGCKEAGGRRQRRNLCLSLFGCREIDKRKLRLIISAKSGMVQNDQPAMPRSASRKIRVKQQRKKCPVCETLSSCSTVKAGEQLFAFINMREHAGRESPLCRQGQRESRLIRSVSRPVFHYVLLWYPDGKLRASA